MPILTLSRILSLRRPYALMAGDRELRLDVALQHFLSRVFLLSLLHINCPDKAPLHVFRKCLSSYVLHRVVCLAAAFVKGHVYSECALIYFTAVLPGSFGTKNEIRHIPSCPFMPFSCTKIKND